MNPSLLILAAGSHRSIRESKSYSSCYQAPAKYMRDPKVQTNSFAPIFQARRFSFRLGIRCLSEPCTNFVPDSLIGSHILSCHGGKPVYPNFWTNHPDRRNKFAGRKERSRSWSLPVRFLVFLSQMFPFRRLFQRFLLFPKTLFYAFLKGKPDATHVCYRLQRQNVVNFRRHQLPDGGLDFCFRFAHSCCVHHRCQRTMVKRGSQSVQLVQIYRYTQRERPSVLAS